MRIQQKTTLDIAMGLSGFTLATAIILMMTAIIQIILLNTKTYTYALAIIEIILALTIIFTQNKIAQELTRRELNKNVKKIE